MSTITMEKTSDSIECKTDKIVSSTIPDKSPSDPRDYKIITLANELECILVSDPEAEKAAMALCVEVGHMADPDTLPGLAHFLEHMLFLGSAKYPKEGEYKQFLKDHGGKSNASTSTHQTTFQFDIGSDYLWEAVDRLSQFFISPLFTKSATDRELNAVNSEASNNQQKDGRRLFQFDKSLSRDTHPFHKFGTGNMQTLRENVDADIDVRSELIQFYRKHYSSSIMKLAIIGKEDIDTMTQKVNEVFTSIPNLKIKKPEYSHDVYNRDTFPALYKLVPIKEIRELRLNWIMDSCYTHTLERPTTLLSYCLGDESKGSVYSYLKELGLATGLSAGCKHSLPEFAVFHCSVSLTVQGLDRWQEVVSIIYEYIEQMKKITDTEWREYFVERSKMKEMNFTCKGKEKSYGYVKVLARALHRNYPRKMYLQCKHGLYIKYDHDLIQKYLSFLTVDNCYYVLIAKQYQDIANQREEWYATRYKKEDIDDKVLEEWRRLSKNDALSRPKANPYITDDLSIYCKENKEEEEEGLPIVIRQTAHSKMWFKMDQTFRKPKLCVHIKLCSPLYNAQGALSINLTNLVMMILNDELTDDTYAPSQASLKYTATYNGFGRIEFTFRGYNQKLHLLITTVLSKLQHLKITKQKYELQRELLERSIVSRKCDQPRAHCKNIKSLFFVANSVSNDDLFDSLKDITFEAVVEQCRKIYEKGYVEALIYGNIDKQTVESTYFDIIDKHLIELIGEGASNEQMQGQGALKLKEDREVQIMFECPNDEEKNSCIACHYVYALDDKECVNVARLRLFAHLIKVPCFGALRTEQQLGYLVKSGAVFDRGLHSFRVLVQSNNYDPIRLNEKIEEFVAGVRKYLEEMDDEIFETNKASVCNNLLEKSKTIKEQNDKYWKEIKLWRYQFERESAVAHKIKALTKHDMLRFYDTVFAKESKQRCKLSVQCFGNQHKMDKDEQNVIRWNITDVRKVRQMYGYYPFPYKLIE
eukprot:114815_1